MFALRRKRLQNTSYILVFDFRKFRVGITKKIKMKRHENEKNETKKNKNEIEKKRK